MEFIIGIGILFGIIFVYGYVKASKWEKEYKIAIGKYYKIEPSKAAKLNRFEGTCYFDEMAKPINVGIRLSKGEKIYAAFDNLSLMAYKRTGGFGFGGIFLRKKVKIDNLEGYVRLFLSVAKSEFRRARPYLQQKWLEP